MKLSEIKAQLNGLETLTFILPDGSFVPENFHVTEVGLINKNFIDCGGTVRKETLVNFQLWQDSNDDEHRLKPGKLLKIIDLSEKALGIGDLEIEVEYQDRTIGKYDLDFDGKHFQLLNKQTACLASDQCGTSDKKKVSLSQITASNNNTCSPDGGCC
jgi:Family of unknown function (DUF6428)